MIRRTLLVLLFVVMVSLTTVYIWLSLITIEPQLKFSALRALPNIVLVGLGSFALLIGRFQSWSTSQIARKFDLWVEVTSVAFAGLTIFAALLYLPSINAEHYFLALVSGIMSLVLSLYGVCSSKSKTEDKKKGVAPLHKRIVEDYRATFDKLVQEMYPNAPDDEYSQLLISVILSPIVLAMFYLSTFDQIFAAILGKETEGKDRIFKDLSHSLKRLSSTIDTDETESNPQLNAEEQEEEKKKP